VSTLPTHAHRSPMGALPAGALLQAAERVQTRGVSLGTSEQLSSPLRQTTVREQGTSGTGVTAGQPSDPDMPGKEYR
jgi:hypothetical protein